VRKTEGKMKLTLYQKKMLNAERPTPNSEDINLRSSPKGSRNVAGGATTGLNGNISISPGRGGGRLSCAPPGLIVLYL